MSSYKYSGPATDDDISLQLSRGRLAEGSQGTAARWRQSPLETRQDEICFPSEPCEAPPCSSLVRLISTIRIPITLGLTQHLVVLISEHPSIVAAAHSQIPTLISSRRQPALLALCTSQDVLSQHLQCHTQPVECAKTKSLFHMYVSVRNNHPGGRYWWR